MKGFTCLQMYYLSQEAHKQIPYLQFIISEVCEYIHKYDLSKSKMMNTHNLLMTEEDVDTCNTDRQRKALPNFDV